MTGDERSSMIATMADDLRAIYRSDVHTAERSIEAYLEHRLKKFVEHEKTVVVEELSRIFFRPRAAVDQPVACESKDLAPLYELLLGSAVDVRGLSSAAMNARLIDAVTTVFDSVNGIIGDIHETLLGEKVELQTIRKIIGSQLEEEAGRESLKAHLDQIQEAFLTAHEAFQEAARMKMAEVLNGLDPDGIAKSVDKGMKLGPLYKAELYETYKARYNECRSWFDTGRFRQDLLREFERICQKKYKTKRRGSS